MVMEQKKSVLIIDDHPLFREGLKKIIKQDNQYQVAGETGTALAGLQAVMKLKPDIVLVDISLPDKNGIELTSEISEQLPETNIIILSVHSKGDYIAKSFQAGAKGYVTKESTPAKLLHGLKAVLNGEYFIDSTLSNEVAKKLIGVTEKEMRFSDDAYKNLTQREQEVLRLIVEDKSIHEISEKLFISPKTIENHRSNIMKKLNLHSDIELVRYAAKIGLIDLDLWVS
jgi:DNA-binding NarL/FixJ family response regulator